MSEAGDPALLGGEEWVLVIQDSHLPPPGSHCAFLSTPMTPGKWPQSPTRGCIRFPVQGASPFPSLSGPHLEMHPASRPQEVRGPEARTSQEL